MLANRAGVRGVALFGAGRCGDNTGQSARLGTLVRGIVCADFCVRAVFMAAVAVAVLKRGRGGVCVGIVAVRTTLDSIAALFAGGRDHRCRHAMAFDRVGILCRANGAIFVVAVLVIASFGKAVANLILIITLVRMSTNQTGVGGVSLFGASGCCYLACIRAGSSTSV